MKKPTDLLEFYVSVQVHDDGDIELTRCEQEAKAPCSGMMYFRRRGALVRELLDYGAELKDIEDALVRLETERSVTI